MVKSKFRLQTTDMKGRRRQLRNRSTPEEKMLWQELKGNKLGRKFIRQYSVDNYVVDFYCPSERLAIELDGGVHSANSQRIYDEYRTRYLESFNIKVLRFLNQKVDENIGEVLNEIKKLFSPA